VAEGFYYEIYSRILIGGGPQRALYPVAEQVADAELGSLRVKADVKDMEFSYQRRGMWYPQEVQANPLESGSGVIVSAYA
jgi:hypothetical protein